MNDWKERLTPLLKEFGASVVGYADMSDVAEAAEAGFSGAVSIGIALSPSVVRELSQGPTLAYHMEYYRVNGMLDQLDTMAADWLIAHGYEASPLTVANTPVDWEVLRSPIPHKTAALRAGHGWIGRSALLVTPEYGPAVRFSTVLTNAPITPAAMRPDGCGACQACKGACPAKAIAGIQWSPDQSRDQYYDAFACQQFATESCQKLGVKNAICGICIHYCPYTQKYLDRERT